MTKRTTDRLRAPRGQAMVEYTIVAHALLLGTVLMLLPMVSQLLDALSAYYESLYFVLKTAAI
jgi:hypothetical protein